jgi:hypothetical protein
MGEGVAQLAETALDGRNGHTQSKRSVPPLTEE